MNAPDETNEAPLTQAEKDIRDNFVNEYILDFSAVDAVIRMGYNRESCHMMLNVFMQDAYVIAGIEDAKKDINRQLERRKNWCGKQLVSIVTDKQNNASARVSAIKQFSEMHGITREEIVDSLDDAIKITRLIINEKNAPTNPDT
jgi:phage terminase small subunit